MLEKLKNLLRFRKSHIEINEENKKTLDQIIEEQKSELAKNQSTKFSKKTLQKLNEISIEITTCSFKIEECYEKRKDLRLEGENELAMQEQVMISELHEKMEKFSNEANEIMKNQILTEEPPIVEPKKEVKTSSTRFRYGPDNLTKLPFDDN